MENMTTAAYNQAARDLLWIWTNRLDEDIQKRKKEALQAEQQLKEFVLANLDKQTRDELNKNRMGCLLGIFFRIIIGLLTGFIFYGPSDKLADNHDIKKSVRKIKKAFMDYDPKTAVQYLYQEQILLPAGANNQLDDCWNKEMQIEFLKDLHSIVSQASDVVRKSPEKAETFVKTYLSLQDEKPDTKSMCKALIEASELLGVDPGNTPDQANLFTSQGAYFDFALRSDIRACANKYRDALM